MTLSEKMAAADYPRMADLLGKTFVGQDNKKYRLVKLASADFGTGSGADAAKNKVFKWSSQADWTVVPAVAATDKICGVTPSTTPNLVVGDLFLIQIRGRCTVTNASDGACVAGEYVIGDDDADKGKVTSGSTTHTEGVDFAIALESNATGDGEVDIEILQELN
jgi:hypothetical protein